MEKLKVNRTFCKGIAIADAFVLKEISLSTAKITVEDCEKEVVRFQAAIHQAMEELSSLAETNNIFKAHIELVQDPSLNSDVVSKINDEHCNAEWALEQVSGDLIRIFAAMEDEYLRERAADMKDISKRLMYILKGIRTNPFADINKKVIVIAKDLTPSDTALMDFHYVNGFITQEGGLTSHVAIIAKSQNIPALVGASGILDVVSNDMAVAMDAESGEIAVEPDESTLRRFQDAMKRYQDLSARLLDASSKPSVTLDGKTVMVCANVGNVKDIENALAFNPDGVGLFRTEFLYMQNTHFPTEEEQFVIYKKAAELLNGKELIIRTLDIGGDKELSYFDFGEEDNPFLGYRAIRICLDHPDMFKAQLRALLRASAYGNIKIMYPMMISVEELDHANAFLEKCKEELTKEGVAYQKNIKVGMMMETPASVILADAFAQKVAFFSIGTNDLTQYTLVVDRGNKKIADMYNSFHPAVLRGIRRIIECGHEAGIPVGMCGEFASDVNAFHLLLGLGLDEFSMSASTIPHIKERLHHAVYTDDVDLAKNAMQYTELRKITSYLEQNAAGLKQ